LKDDAGAGIFSKGLQALPMRVSLSQANRGCEDEERTVSGAESGGAVSPFRFFSFPFPIRPNLMMSHPQALAVIISTV
jgi:hypothetical protein